MQFNVVLRTGGLAINRKNRGKRGVRRHNSHTWWARSGVADMEVLTECSKGDTQWNSTFSGHPPLTYTLGVKKGPWCISSSWQGWSPMSFELTSILFHTCINHILG